MKYTVLGYGLAIASLCFLVSCGSSDSDEASEEVLLSNLPEAFVVNPEADQAFEKHLSTIESELPATLYASNRLLENLRFTEDEKRGWKRRSLKVALPWILNDQHAPLYIAEKKGFFEVAKLDVELKEGGPARGSLKLLLGGSVDVGISSGGNQVIRMTTSRTGGEVMAIGVINRASSYIWMMMDESIPKEQRSTRVLKPSDFIGKSVGLQEGGDVYQAFFLKQFNMPADQIKFTRAGATPDVLLTGAIDFFGAVFDNQPRLLEGMGYYNWTAFRFADYGWEDYYNTHVVRKQTFEQEPELLRRYLWALREATQFMLDNPEEAADIVLNYDMTTQLTREQVLRRFELGRASIEAKPDMPLLFMNMKQWDRIAALLLMYDQIEL